MFVLIGLGVVLLAILLLIKGRSRLVKVSLSVLAVVVVLSMATYALSFHQGVSKGVTTTTYYVP